MSNTRVVILLLGGVALLALAGIIYLSAAAKPTPDVLVATVSGSLGALSAVLVRASGGEPPAEP